MAPSLERFSPKARFGTLTVELINMVNIHQQHKRPAFQQFGSCAYISFENK